MRFKRLLEKNGLPHMTFHDLRHMNASVMAMLRIPDKYAMERGG
jgi:integrase